MDGTRLEGKGVVGNAMRRKTKVSFCAAPPICHVKSIIPPSQNCQLVLDKEPVTLGSQHAWATLSVLDDLDLPYTIETHDLPELKERVRSSASASTSSAERENGGRKLNQTRQRRNETTTAGLRLTDRQLTSHIKNCYDVPELHALWLGHASSLNSMHVAAFLHRLGKCHDVSKPCNLSLTLNMLSHLDEAFSLHLEDYSAREVSMAFWSWGTLSHRPPHHVWTSVCHAITEGADRNKGVSSLLAHAAPQSIAMLAWGMVKISGCSQSEAERSPMDTLEENQVAQKKPSDENEELVWDAIEAASRQSLRSLPPRDLANIVWSFASAGRHNVAFFNLLADASIARINDFTPQDLSNTAWAFATVRHPYKPLFEAIAGASLRILHAFTPQAIANLMWAFAVVRIDNAEELMDVASKEAMRRLESFLPAHLSMMAWALARSAGRSGSRASSDTTVQGLSSIARVASMRLSSFKSKEIALVLWSLSWAKGNDDNLLFDSAPSELLARLKRQSLSWQDKAHILWSFSSAEQYDSRLFESIAESCLSSSQLSPGLISQPAALDTIISSLATSGHYNKRLFSAAASALSGSVIHVKGVLEARHSQGKLLLNPAQATSILRALALMDHVDTDACDSVVSGLLSCIPLRSSRDVSSQDPSLTLHNNSCLVSCLMSLAVMNHSSFNLDLLHLVVKHVKATIVIHRQAAKQEGSDTNQEMKRQRFQETLQLLQAVSWLEDQVRQVPKPPVREAHLKDMPKPLSAISLKRAKDIQQILDELPHGLIERARASWRSGAASVQRISKLQQGVNASLIAIGLRPRMESMTRDGMFSVDIVVPRWRSHSDVAVEVNGPYHYARVNVDDGMQPRPLGTKVLRDRFLKSRGFAVANISWLEWEEVDGDPAKMKEVVISALDRAIDV